METLMIYCRTCEAWIDANVFPDCHLIARTVWDLEGSAEEIMLLERMWRLPNRG